MWRTAGHAAGWNRSEITLAALERRVTLLWATVASALGHQVSEDDITGPFDTMTTASPAQPRGGEDEPETQSLREIALWMRGA